MPLRRIDPLVRLLLVAIVLASVLPVSDRWRGVAQAVSNAAVFLLFLLNGLRLPRAEVIRGIGNLRFLLPLVLWCFGAMALAGWGFWAADVGVLLAGVFLMGVHSTLFGPVKFADQGSEYPIAGVQPVFQDVRNYYVEKGRFFSALDDAGRARVTVLGHGVLKDLKLPGDPIGRDVLISGRAYRIIGVMESKGQLLGEDLDKFVMIPYGTLSAEQGQTGEESTALLIRSTTSETVDAAEAEIENALRIRHRLRPEQPNDFEIHTQKELLKTFSKIANGVTYVVAGVVSIALLVGGIGIMNIMLVSVTERTREIGVRKAVGAKRAHILAQFVIEAITLALVGGIVGIVMGIGVGAIAAKLIPNWPGFFVPVWALVLSFGFSSAVGLFFGIYPAAKASRLDPIESLRYE